MDERIESFHYYEKESEETDHLDDREVKVTDHKICSLTDEERYDIIREYNAEYSIRRSAPNVIDRAERPDTSVIDSEDSSDVNENTDSIERLAHLLGELAEVGNIVVKNNMRFLDSEQLDELLAVGQKFLVGCKSSVVAERTGNESEQDVRIEVRDAEE
ncbi:MAG: hypothetical protein RTV31_16430 [Candidatus Thorarchaeota archaeon]